MSPWFVAAPGLFIAFLVVFGGPIAALEEWVYWYLLERELRQSMKRHHA